MNETTIELRNEFTGVGEVKGFEFRQISKSEQAYIYEVLSGDKLYYEIFKRLKSHVCIDFEKREYSETEFKETYPKSNQFGITAWTTKDLEDAAKRFNELSNPE